MYAEGNHQNIGILPVPGAGNAPDRGKNLTRKSKGAPNETAPLGQSISQFTNDLIKRSHAALIFAKTEKKLGRRFPIFSLNYRSLSSVGETF